MNNAKDFFRIARSKHNNCVKIYIRNNSFGFGYKINNEIFSDSLNNEVEKLVLEMCEKLNNFEKINDQNIILKYSVSNLEQKVKELEKQIEFHEFRVAGLKRILEKAVSWLPSVANKEIEKMLIELSEQVKGFKK